jgi:hypothetical protein
MQQGGKNVKWKEVRGEALLHYEQMVTYVGAMNNSFLTIRMLQNRMVEIRYIFVDDSKTIANSISVDINTSNCPDSLYSPLLLQSSVLDSSQRDSSSPVEIR